MDVDDAPWFEIPGVPEIRTDSMPRNATHTQVRQWPYVWEFTQILVDEPLKELRSAV